MKTIYNIFRGALLMLLVTTILSSCSNSISVQKRHYTKGYHVELFKKKKDNSDKPDGKETATAVVDQTTSTEKALVALTEPTKEQSIEVNTEKQDVNTVKQEVIVTKEISSERELKPNVQSKEEKLIARNIERVKKMISKSSPPVAEKKADTKYHWASITSFVFGVLGILSPIVFGLIALTLGLVSLSAIKHNEDRYKGRGYAIAGLVLGAFWIFIVFLLFALILAVL